MLVTVWLPAKRPEDLSSFYLHLVTTKDWLWVVHCFYGSFQKQLKTYFYFAYCITYACNFLWSILLYFLVYQCIFSIWNLWINVFCLTGQDSFEQSWALSKLLYINQVYVVLRIDFSHGLFDFYFTHCNFCKIQSFFSLFDHRYQRQILIISEPK